MDLGQIIETKDGSLTLVHPEHEQAYHSTSGARFEARALYLFGSGVAEQFETGRYVSILDVGLGLGYNALETISYWLETPYPGPLNIVSLEHNGDLVKALLSGQAPWQKDTSKIWQKRLASAQWLSENRAFISISHPMGSICHWEIVVGDALAFESRQQFSHVYHDPFSIDKNPNLWSKEWFVKVNEHASDDCVLVTYSVARKVREALKDGGWLCEKFNSPGRSKRDWLKASPSTSET